MLSGLAFSSSGQHQDGNKEMGEAPCTGTTQGTSLLNDQADVLPARQGQREIITEIVGENESLVRGSISEEGAADRIVGEKVASSNLEVEEVREGVMNLSEKENLLVVRDLSIAGAGQGLVTKENPKEQNLDKGLTGEQFHSKSEVEVASPDGENDLEKFDKLRRILTGRVGSIGKGLASKALKKQQLKVEEEFAPKRRRLASQGKLKEGDRLKVPHFYVY